MSSISPKFKIYSSSAGSGKTYTLAKEYLKLALKTQNAYYFTHILAVTFTNKAAQEMKERILKYLHAFAHPDRISEKERQQSADLLSQIRAEMKSENATIEEEDILFEVELRRRAARVFKAILHEYANFSVSTIDSFVQRIVSAFAEELELPYNFEVNLDSEILLEAAIEKMLEKANDAAYTHITEAIESYTLEKANEGKSWNSLPNELARFGYNVLNDKNTKSLEKLKDLKEKDFVVIEKQMIEFQDFVINKIKLIAQTALETIDGAGVERTDFFQSKNGAGMYFERIFNGEIFREKNSYIDKFINEQQYYSKTQKQPIKAAIDAIAEELTFYLTTLGDIQVDSTPKYTLFTQILRNLKKMSLLNQIRLEVADIQSETGQVHISEFNQKILEVVLNEPVPFVYERLGERYNHILIDEFQDTSVLQWHNFLPLIENSLANGHFNLAVGDAKQSIYRFRGGEMELIVNLHKKQLTALGRYSDNELITERLINIAPYLKSESLNTNYRSTKEIIEFNNALFQEIAQNLINQAIAPSLPKVYDENFQQKIPNKPKTGGHVQIDFLTQKEEELTIARTLKIIKEVLANGYECGDIAILCRKNLYARQVANVLKEREYEVISSESLSLYFSEAVNLIVAIMQVIKAPDNRLAKTEALYLFYRIVLHEIPNTETNNLIREVAESEDSNQFYEFIEDHGYFLDSFKLQQMSLTEVAENIMGTFSLFERGKDIEFLFRFLDVVIDFSLNKSSHLTDFLDFWEKKKNSLSIISPEGQNAITVMSIHKSKGLEFPVVIVPFCDWSTDTNLYTDIWADISPNYDELEVSDEESTRNLQTSYFKVVNDLEKTEIKEQFLEEKEKTFLESLNMLYVALTRPTERLYLIARKTDRNFEKSIGFQLHSYCVRDAMPITPRLEIGASQSSLSANSDLQQSLAPISNWCGNGIASLTQITELETYLIAADKPKTEDNKNKKQENELIINEIISTNQSSNVRLKHSVERLMNLEDIEKSKDWGNIVHTAFAKIKTKNDVEDAIYGLLKDGYVKENEQAKLRDSILKIIDLPELKKLFSEEAQVKNEREILKPNGELLRPDRVVLLKQKIYILDYKTGVKSNSHKEQVQGYINIYKEMGYPSVFGMIVYLEDLSVVEV